MSSSHVPIGSQATSVMIPGSTEVSFVPLAPVKKTDIDESSSLVRFFQVAFVYVKLVITALPYMKAPAVYVHCSRLSVLQLTLISAPSKTL